VPAPLLKMTPKVPDRGVDGVSLDSAWRALGARLAVFSGCAVALLSLALDSGALVAVGFGALVFFGVRAVAALGLVAIHRLPTPAAIETKKASR